MYEFACNKHVFWQKILSKHLATLIGMPIHDMGFCCYSQSASRFSMLCILGCSSAHNGCKELYLSYLSLYVSSNQSSDLTRISTCGTAPHCIFRGFSHQFHRLWCMKVSGDQCFLKPARLTLSTMPQSKWMGYRCSYWSGLYVYDNWTLEEGLWKVLQSNWTWLVLLPLCNPSRINM